jgi:hypothetical protein
MKNQNTEVAFENQTHMKSPTNCQQLSWSLLHALSGTHAQTPLCLLLNLDKTCTAQKNADEQRNARNANVRACSKHPMAVLSWPA